ncbi:cytochrome P450 6g1-like [Musca domestica]|uniref:Cytochrome P450 6g1-like n=1 Tax=Musca domestica TaxID=7370 RepID=A0A1I8MCX7_MUSDO|nr:cytochrome P450 6g1-like [Musca domestica]
MTCQYKRQKSKTTGRLITVQIYSFFVSEVKTSMFLTAFLTFFVIICSILSFLYHRNFNYWTRFKNVPSVPGRIFSGNVIDFLTFKTNFGFHLKTIYDDEKFTSAPVVGVYGLYKPSLLIRDPDIIKSVLIKDFDRFHDRFAKIDYHHDPLGGQMMLFADYPLWKEMRTKLSPTFTSGKLKNMYPLIQQVGENMVKFLDSKPSVFQVEVKDLCARFTTDVIATTVFGFQSNSLANPAEDFYKQLRLLNYFTWRRSFDFIIVLFASQLTRIMGAKILYPETEHFLRSAITQAVREREACIGGEKRNDIIDTFVKLKQEAEQRGERNIEQLMECLIAQAGIFMVGGFDTSSTTMSNALLELAKDTSVQKKLREETKEAFVEGNGEISYEALNKLTYLEMVINETLRLYPVLAVLERQHATAGGKEPYSLQPYCDFNLPDGMPVFIPVFGLHYDTKYWSNPKKFDPERFSPENKPLINPMVYLPFGNGPHNCIGSRLAMMQVKAGLFYILKDHLVRVCDRTELEPTFDPKLNALQVKGGIHLEIVKDE